MKKVMLSVILILGAFCLSGTAFADSVAEVYTCTLKEGKTIADAQAINTKWLAWMRANVSEDIESTAATVLVGDSGSFLYVDIYPDVETWAAGDAALQTPEGQAAEAGFLDVMECSGNRLWRLQETQ